MTRTPPPLKRPPPPRRPRVQRPGRALTAKVSVYFARHAQVLLSSLGRLWRTPFATLMTAAVLGIALALPFGLQSLLTNAERLSSGWDGATQISLFLRADVSRDQALTLRDRLEHSGEIARVRYISPQQALDEFERLSGFGDVLTALDKNPLPGVLVVHPVLQQGSPAAVQALLARLRGYPEVDLAQLDMQWVKRLYAIMDMLNRGIQALAVLLALAVVLVVGNTIRLAIENRRDEIVITKLIGGTDAFIRRPFLYTGFWYGLFGALLAYGMIAGMLMALDGPVAALSGLYNSQFQLASLGAGNLFLLLASGIVLGLLGSAVAVRRHLRDIEPT